MILIVERSRATQTGFISTAGKKHNVLDLNAECNNSLFC
jgi:hypothetical protein